MSYRDAREHVVRWTDGMTWKADEATFARTTGALGAVASVIEGLAPVLSRWSALAARGEDLPVDDFAGTEDDRAVFTAGLARALDDARATPPDPKDAESHAHFLASLKALHELFMTDITRR